MPSPLVAPVAAPQVTAPRAGAPVATAPRAAEDKGLEVARYVDQIAQIQGAPISNEDREAAMDAAREEYLARRRSSLSPETQANLTRPSPFLPQQRAGRRTQAPTSLARDEAREEFAQEYVDALKLAEESFPPGPERDAAMQEAKRAFAFNLINNRTTAAAQSGGAILAPPSPLAGRLALPPATGEEIIPEQPQSAAVREVIGRPDPRFVPRAQSGQTQAIEQAPALAPPPPPAKPLTRAEQEVQRRQQRGEIAERMAQARRAEAEQAHAIGDLQGAKNAYELELENLNNAWRLAPLADVGRKQQLRRAINEVKGRLIKIGGQLKPTKPGARAARPVDPNAPTAGVATPLLEQVNNPEGGVPARTEPLSGIFGALARKQERAEGERQDNVRLAARIRQLGGINPGGIYTGELRSAVDKKYPGLINRKDGIKPDTLIQYLAEENYPVDPADLDSLFRAIDDDIAGKEVYPTTRSRTEELDREFADYYANQPSVPLEAEQAGGGTAPLAERPAAPESAARPVQEAPRTEKLRVPKATPENIKNLRSRRDELSRLRYDRGDQLTGDLADEYRELGSRIAEYENEQAQAARGGRPEPAPPVGMQIDERPFGRPTPEDQRRALGAAEARLGAEIDRAIGTLPREDAEALEQGVAAIDALFGAIEEDADIADLFNRAVEGDADAETELRRYADRQLGIDADALETVLDTGRERRLGQGAQVRGTASQSQAEVARPSEDRTRVEAAPQAQALSPQDLNIISTDPAEIHVSAEAGLDANVEAYDRGYLDHLEDLRNRSIRGLADPPEWAQRQLEARLKQGLEVRRQHVKDKLLPARYQPLPLKAQPLSKEEGGRRLVEQAKKKETEKAEEPPTVTHPNPELDRQPILAETNRGTVLVANPNNKTGVSEIKDRSDEPSDYKFSSTQVNLPKEIADQIIAFGKRIPDTDLADDGRETEPHITVKYGLHGSDPKFVQDALAGERPATVKFGKVSLFENDEFDVVKIDVDSPDLHQLNKKVAESQPVTDTFPTYQPHATIAYVKKGKGAKYVGDTFLEGKTATLDSVTFSGRDGDKVEIPLESDDDRIVRERAQAALEIARTSPVKQPWQMTRAEFDALPKAYRGVGERNRATEGLLFITPNRGIASAHGRRIMEGRVIDPSRLVPDPEVEGEQGRDLTGEESFRLGSASTTLDNFPPDKHDVLVERAVREGKPVPNRVLADYPDIAKPSTRPLVTNPLSSAAAKERKRLIGRLMPFNIQGNKADLLAKGLGGVIERAAKGTRRIIDAFAGTGAYTHYLRSKGLGHPGDILNEFDPLRYITHKQLKENPKEVAREAARTLREVRELLKDAREGERFTEKHEAIRRQVADYFQRRLRGLVAPGESLRQRARAGEAVEMQDTPETAGLYLILQNQSFNFLPVQAEVSDDRIIEEQGRFFMSAPLKEPRFRLPGFGVISNEGGKVGLFARGKSLIFETAERAAGAGQRMQGVDVRRGDGWELVRKEAGKGDLVPVDTSYLNRPTGEETSNYSQATAEDAVPEIYMENVRKNLLPAWDRGAKLVVTNNWDKRVADYLRSLGFDVVKAARQGASREDIKAGGAAELVAINFDKKTGEIFRRPEREDRPMASAQRGATERSEYWGTPPVPRTPSGFLIPLTEAQRAEHFEHSRAQFRQHATRARVYANEQGAFTYAAAINKTVGNGDAIPIAIDGVAVPINGARKVIRYLLDRLAEKQSPARKEIYNNLAYALEQAVRAAERKGDNAITIVNTEARMYAPEGGSRRSFEAVRQVAAHEETHVWQMNVGGLVRRGLFSDEAITSDPDYTQQRYALVRAGYPKNMTPDDVSAEAIAHVAAGQWRDLGYRTEGQAMKYLARVLDRAYTELGAEAVESLRLRTPKSKEAREDVRARRTDEGVGRGTRPGATARTIAGGEIRGTQASLSGREGEGRRPGEGAPREVQRTQPTESGVALASVQRGGFTPTPDQSGVRKGYVRATDASGKIFIVEKKQAGIASPAPRATTPQPAPERARPLPKQAAPQTSSVKPGQQQTLFPQPTQKLTAGQKIVATTTIPRALMASADLSAPLRQGALLSVPPTQWGKAARSGLRMLQSISKTQHARLVEELNNHPDAKVGKAVGLDMVTAPDKKRREEDFTSEFAEKIPFGVGRVVGLSRRTYEMYMDSLRLETFRKYKKVIDQDKKLSQQDRLKAYQAAAEWINIASGRGSLGETFDKAMPALSAAFFAPRYTASRIQLLNPMTYLRNINSPAGRAVMKQQISDVVQFGGMVAATLALAQMAGASINWDDPEDPDWLKIKFGNKRYDILAGTQQLMRLYFRVGKDFGLAAIGEEAEGPGTFDILARFARSKAAPIPSFFWDMISRKDFIGRDFEMSRAVKDRVVPLMWNDFIEAYQREGLGSAAKLTPGFFGVGVQDYEKRPGYLQPLGETLDSELDRHKLKFGYVNSIPGDTEKTHRERTERIERWLKEYGGNLINHPRYKSMTESQQKEALQTLRDRIGAEANQKAPALYNLTEWKIIRSTLESERRKPARDRQKIVVAPPD